MDGIKEPACCRHGAPAAVPREQPEVGKTQSIVDDTGMKQGETATTRRASDHGDARTRRPVPVPLLALGRSQDCDSLATRIRARRCGRSQNDRHHAPMNWRSRERHHRRELRRAVFSAEGRQPAAVVRAHERDRQRHDPHWCRWGRRFGPAHRPASLVGGIVVVTPFSRECGELGLMGWADTPLDSPVTTAAMGRHRGRIRDL